ncbi:hypothetical protein CHINAEXTREME_00605 [Halobiforma lacisalsi AJ5]|uniref:Uncharacterized protein n=1 Tax=Natronobacterium lacisalsi AJ5 TaxID=358396 RepID=M0L4K3_NATLA|nr:hypothetical protein [Halobiforma lacisalsi]APW96351.1 hypothetical protein CHINAEXTREME_00605 [Halobiforma lacisalsi AJ5]EMA27374.1 hypothetical protein C445_20380 [Halobiforma lacisalsi AJ5]
MSRTPTRAFHGERSNAYLSWAAIAVVAIVGTGAALEGRVHELLFAVTVVTVALVPAIELGTTRAALPWEVTTVAVVPLVAAVIAPDLPTRQLLLYAGAATIALALTLELHGLTEVRLERWVAVAAVTMLSASIAATWAMVTWAQDLVAGTDVLESNAELMRLLIAASVAGLVAGVCFDRYYRKFPGEELVSAPVDGIEEQVFAVEADLDDHPSLEERLPVSGRVTRLAILTLRLGIAAMLAYGLVAFDTGAITNAAAMLAVSFLPTLLRRRYGLPFDGGLVLWITVVVFLHAVGSVYVYERSFWWHNLTHPLSATLVAGTGYVVIRTLDEHRDEVHLPLELVPGVVAVFVLSFGVFWDIGEFALDAVAAGTGLEMPLSQYGLHDTITDLLFNTLGGVVVALWGLPYLTDLTDAVTDRVEDWRVFDG